MTSHVLKHNMTWTDRQWELSLTTCPHKTRQHENTRLMKITSRVLHSTRQQQSTCHKKRRDSQNKTNTWNMNGPPTLNGNQTRPMCLDPNTTLPHTKQLITQHGRKSAYPEWELETKCSHKDKGSRSARMFGKLKLRYFLQFHLAPLAEKSVTTSA